MLPDNSQQQNAQLQCLTASSTSQHRCKICYTILVKPGGAKQGSFYSVNSDVQTLLDYTKQVVTSIPYIPTIEPSVSMAAPELFFPLTHFQKRDEPEAAERREFSSLDSTLQPKERFLLRHERSPKVDINCSSEAMLDEKQPKSSAVSCTDLIDRFLGLVQDQSSCRSSVSKNAVAMSDDSQTAVEPNLLPLAPDTEKHGSFEHTSIVASSSSSHSDIICARCCSILLRMSELNITFQALASHLRDKYKKTLRIIGSHNGQGPIPAAATCTYSNNALHCLRNASLLPRDKGDETRGQQWHKTGSNAETKQPRRIKHVDGTTKQPHQVDNGKRITASLDVCSPSFGRNDLQSVHDRIDLLSTCNETSTEHGLNSNSVSASRMSLGQDQMLDRRHPYPLCGGSTRHSRRKGKPSHHIRTVYGESNILPADSTETLRLTLNSAVVSRYDADEQDCERPDETAGTGKKAKEASLGLFDDSTSLLETHGVCQLAKCTEQFCFNRLRQTNCSALCQSDSPHFSANSPLRSPNTTNGRNRRNRNAVSPIIERVAMHESGYQVPARPNDICSALDKFHSIQEENEQNSRGTRNLHGQDSLYADGQYAPCASDLASANEGNSAFNREYGDDANFDKSDSLDRQQNCRNDAGDEHAPMRFSRGSNVDRIAASLMIDYQTNQSTELDSMKRNKPARQTSSLLGFAPYHSVTDNGGDGCDGGPSLDRQGLCKSAVSATSQHHFQQHSLRSRYKDSSPCQGDSLLRLLSRKRLCLASSVKRTRQRLLSDPLITSADEPISCDDAKGQDNDGSGFNKCEQSSSLIGDIAGSNNEFANHDIRTHPHLASRCLSRNPAGHMECSAHHSLLGDKSSTLPNQLPRASEMHIFKQDHQKHTDRTNCQQDKRPFELGSGLPLSTVSKGFVKYERDTSVSSPLLLDCTYPPTSFASAVTSVCSQASSSTYAPQCSTAAISSANLAGVPVSLLSTCGTSTVSQINSKVGGIAVPLGNAQVHSRQVGTFKRYQCGFCGKVVTNIQIHVRRHTNEKPYTCQYCDKRFTNSGDLQIHTRIHTGEKPYRCPLCGKSYRTIGNFNSHVKTHDNGERPHRCALCNETFGQMRDWFSHLRSNHKQSIVASSSVPAATACQCPPSQHSPSVYANSPISSPPLFSTAKAVTGLSVRSGSNAAQSEVNSDECT